MNTADVAPRLEQSLARDAVFAHYARWFEADVALAGMSGDLTLRFQGEAVRCLPEASPDADIVLRAEPQTWAELEDPDAVNVTLTKWLRQGDVLIEGDIDRAMNNWRPIFWAVARLREQLSGVSEF